MVGLGIAEPEIEKRRVRDLPDVDQTKDEREQRDRQQQGPAKRRYSGGRTRVIGRTIISAVLRIGYFSSKAATRCQSS